MQRAFTKDHVIILPHAEEYRLFYDVSREDVLRVLNEPDTHEGLATGYYTVEKQMGGHRLFLYYYLTLPLQAARDEVYAIVDFIGYATISDLLPK